MHICVMYVLQIDRAVIRVWWDTREKVGGSAECCLALKQPRDCGELLTHDDSHPTMPGVRAIDPRTRRRGTG